MSGVVSGSNMGGGALGGLGGSLEDKECDLMCPVCFELIDEAYVTRCGHSFCYECISKAVELHRRCPKCGAQLASREHIFPNFLLNELVAKKRLTRSASAATVTSGTLEAERLKELVTVESTHLDMPDVEVMLDVLQRRKRALEAESSEWQRRLVRGFLSRLLRHRRHQLSQLAREAALVEADLNALKAGDDDASPIVDDVPANLPDSEPSADSDTGERFARGAGGAGLASRWQTLAAHFDDFVQCYLAHRASDLYFPGKGGDSEPTKVEAADATENASEAPQATSAENWETKNSSAGDKEEISEGLAAFRADVAAFTRYRTLRPLATLAYSSDAINYSTIVSTIEFDKDEEIFAIAGVTKRIKVFSLGEVARDALDVHYPAAEMQCAHKVSCLSWNKYHKQILASADYEGTVSVWDAGTGQRTRALHEHDKRCWSVHFSRADVRLLASGSDDARVKLWALNCDRSVATLEAKFNVCCVRFNPKSSCHLAFGSADHCVHYYDLRSPRHPLAVFKDHRKAVSYVKFLDAKTIVSASTDSQLKLWSVDSPRCVRSYTGHTNEKNFVGLATDGSGKYIACGSENNSLYIYYAGLARPMLSHRFEGGRGALERSAPSGGEPGEFVSAVCWRRAPPLATRHLLLAANSHGTVKLLELL